MPGVGSGLMSQHKLVNFTVAVYFLPTTSGRRIGGSGRILCRSRQLRAMSYKRAHHAQAERCDVARSLLLSQTMKHLHTAGGKKLPVLLFASLFLSLLAPSSLLSAPTSHPPGSLTAREHGLNRDATPQLPADRADADTQRPENQTGDTTLRHEEPQGQFRAGDSYVPSDQELRLFYPPGSRRPLWGY